MRRWGRKNALLVLGFVVGCTADGATPPVVREIALPPQDALAYVQPAAADLSLLSTSRQEELLGRFREAFFRPWGQGRASRTQAQVLSGFRRFGGRGDLYGPNLRKLAPGWTGPLQDLAGLDQYPNCARPAITVRNTHLRELPTGEPAFKSPALPGEGYPFDVLQDTALWVGTPLFVNHVAPGGWAHVESPIACGWMPVQDLAFADEDFMRSWQRLPLAAVVNDHCVIRGADASSRLVARIGAVLPLTGADDAGTHVAVPVSDGARRAVAAHGWVSPADARAMPLPLTPANAARLANQMLGQPYGWGGLYENRDCSAATRDLMTPFGIWLPRNSSQQARAGTLIALGNLPGDAKETVVLQKGVPWLTLLHAPGHVMLYIGRRDGRAIIWHNFWGIITRRDSREERHVVGRCVISTLQPGIELPDIALPKGDRRNTIDSMILLAPPEGP